MKERLPGTEIVIEGSRTPLASKLRRRIAAGKRTDIIIADHDGTTHIKKSGGNRDGVDEEYYGKNPETARMLLEKSLGFVLNTARPSWNPYEDGKFLRVGLPLPDVVIAGFGTVILWRQQDGTLKADQEYSKRLEEHKIRINGRDESFSPQLVADAMRPLLQNIDTKVLGEPYITTLPDDVEGLDALRLIAKGMPYEKIAELSKDLQELIPGVKLQMSEMTDLCDADLFTGWLHIVPSIAGKDEGIKYLLSQIKRFPTLGPEQVLHGHLFGDTGGDFDMLTMPSNPEDGYILHQYAVANLPQRTESALKKFIEETQVEQGSNSAHLTLLNHRGPDAIHHIVSTL